MGGVYYIKNQIMQLLSYPPARKNLNIYLYTSKNNETEYCSISKYSNVHIIYKEDIEKKFIYQFGKAVKEEFDADLFYITLCYRIAYIFPYFPKGDINKRLFLKKSIAWIPDFQHEHLPQYFSRREIAGRNCNHKEIAREHHKLVLSSQDAYRDYLTKYSNYKDNVYVVPFCSMLDKQMVKKDRVDEVKQKFGIQGNYFIICNQLWMHKNHLVAFEALKKVMEKERDITIVCTGATEDTRNKKYFHEVKQFIADRGLDKNIYLLGLIDKEEQIQLIKGALALIQPSLFEGWGTCVEDAKTLGKRILLSDIPVHYEQMNEQSKIFKRDDAEQLAQLMLQLWTKGKGEAPKSGYRLKNAKKYGKLFYEMLDERRI